MALGRHTFCGSIKSTNQRHAQSPITSAHLRRFRVIEIFLRVPLTRRIGLDATEHAIAQKYFYSYPSLHRTVDVKRMTGPAVLGVSLENAVTEWKGRGKPGWLNQPGVLQQYFRSVRFICIVGYTGSSLLLTPTLEYTCTYVFISNAQRECK